MSNGAMTNHIAGHSDIIGKWEEPQWFWLLLWNICIIWTNQQSHGRTPPDVYIVTIETCKLVMLKIL